VGYLHWGILIQPHRSVGMKVWGLYRLDGELSLVKILNLVLFNRVRKSGLLRSWSHKKLFGRIILSLWSANGGLNNDSGWGILSTLLT
jgi:hypothetical protein